MPYIVKWTENAAMGLVRAYDFLAGKNADAALLAIRAIREKATLLERFPSAGRPARDLDPEQRELIIPFGASGYVLLYEVVEDCVFLLALRHQKEAAYHFV